MAAPGLAAGTKVEGPIKLSAAELTREGIRGVVDFSKNRVSREDDSKSVLPQAGIYLLDVIVNEEQLPEIVEVAVVEGKGVILPEDAWKAARLKFDNFEPIVIRNGENGYALGSVADLDYEFDLSRQALRIFAPAGAFNQARVGLRRNRSQVPERPPMGFYLNYDLTGFAMDDGATSFSGNLNATVFNGWGAFSTGALVRGSNRGEGFEAIRTETFWQRDLPGRLTTLVLGDTYGTDSGWSRPVRYGGIRFGRKFDLDPSFVTFPLPSIEGSAALPSTVDILVNDTIRQRDVKFAPGPFSVGDIPVVNGAGQINLVVRDLNGRETVLSQDYYFSPDLLAKGLSDFSFEAGWMRKRFGRKSNDYGPAFAAATWRQGVTGALTVEGRVELQKDRQAAGIAGNATIGSLLSVRAAVAYSKGEQTDGGRYLVAAERNSGRFGVRAQWEHFDRGFEQFGSSETERRPKDRLQFGGSTTLVSWLSLAGNYIQETTWNGDEYRILAANLSASLPGDFFLSAYASDNLGHGKGWTAGLTLTRSFGSRRSASASVARSENGDLSEYLRTGQAAPAGPGMGWRVQARNNGVQSLQAGATLNTSNVQLDGDVDVREGSNALRIGARGSIGLLKGLPFASRRIDDRAFAVVKVGDLPGVRVFRSNQHIATTNSHGLALVTGLLPYQNNKISFEAGQLPFNVDIGGTEENAVPYARSGIFIDFPVRRSLNALLTLVMPDGTAVPLGATVSVAGGEEYIVGKHGKAYLTNLGPQNDVVVSWSGGSCAVSFALDPEAKDEARIGPITCGDAQ